MAKRFTPVLDPEKARCEQDEESLRKHRQFDTPFALLPKNLNNPKQPREDLQPLSKPTEELYQDENKLWRKKTELFEKKITWGRETFEYSNPEEARGEGSNSNRKWRPGDVGWGVRGTRGGRGEDNGHAVLQRGEVDQVMVKNEKGLWVKQKKEVKEVERTRSEERSPVPEGGWKCPKCGAGNSKSTYICKSCGIDRSMFEQYKTRPGEDPRLEAAKPKGRGGADAQARALAALEERRRQERAVKEELGMTRREMPGQGGRSGPVSTLNSGHQQVRAAKRLRKFDNWQGVQRTDEQAAKVVSRALGGQQASDAKQPLRVEDVLIAEREAKKKEERERSRSPSGPFAWQSPEDGSQSGGEEPSGAAGSGVAEVDFF